MWTQVILLSCITAVVFGEITAPGIDRVVNDGVTSMGYKVVYGNEDMTLINQVVTDVEKSVLKDKTKLNDWAKPLPAQDVKCLMSVDRYCSKEMAETKSILIQAIMDDCSKCSVAQKDGAGKVAAAMMAHDPVAWKLFLTRYNGLQKIQRILA